MKIGILTTWNQRCGIASYSKMLREELIKAKQEVTVLANIPYEPLVEPDEENVHRIFSVRLRTSQKYCDYGKATELTSKLDVLVIQLENLYDDYLMTLIPIAKNFNCKVIVEAHSSCIEFNKLPLAFVNLVIAHDHGVFHCFPKGMKKTIIPMGIPVVERTPNLNQHRIVSFGLGRNQDGWVNDSVFSLKNQYPNIKFEPKYGDREKWMPLNELLDYLKNSDIITLLYPQVGAYVSSSAVGIALSTYRPVIVTNTNWFTSVKDSVIQVSKPEELTSEIDKLFSSASYYNGVVSRADELRKDRPWNKIVQDHINLYGSLI